MEMSRNISLFNNALFECRKNGMWIYLDNDLIFIENNVVIGIYDRDDIDTSDSSNYFLIYNYVIASETTTGIEIRDP